MIRDIGYNRKFKYLSIWMNKWIDAWPKPIKPFDRWLESVLDKKENKGQKIHTEKTKLICCYCRRMFDEYVDRTKDHVIPLSKGGFDVKENRKKCCFDCNQWKADKMPHEWLTELIKLIKKDRIIYHPYDRNTVGIMIGNLKKIINEVYSDWQKVSTYKLNYS